MNSPFKVVDLFAGPGGLAEGFSAFRHKGKPAFEIALSVEKETSAFATLRLRSFLRKFNRLPEEYYLYLDGKMDKATLISRFPEEWEQARQETHLLELGQPEAELTIDPLLEKIRADSGGRTILIGGPPCQAYSLAGRARNKGIAGYVASDDHRHFLYREYIRIIGKLQPAAFVMENVKGFLSARVDGQGIFRQVLADLQGAGGAPDSYRILPLASASGAKVVEHVLEAERFGVPQRRHRVILFGVRKDVAPAATGFALSEQALEPSLTAATVADVLQDMPKLRSALSKGPAGSIAWRDAVSKAMAFAAEAAYEDGDENFDRVAFRLQQYSILLGETRRLAPLASTRLAQVKGEALSKWLIDPRLRSLPNHQARSHMTSDLARYAYASVFAQVVGPSPKARDFPIGLAPNHDNWSSGIFSDRFRVQVWGQPSTTVTSHISKDGHYFIHPDPMQCRSLTVREAARLQTFPDNYFFEGNRTEQYVQVGNAVPPYLALQLASAVHSALATKTSAT